MVTITEIKWNNNVHLNPTKCSPTVGGMVFTVPIGFNVGVFLVWQGLHVLIYCSIICDHFLVQRYLYLI